MRLSRDGYLDLRDPRRVRTPGRYDSEVEPAPVADALTFLFSHGFPGHRRIVRGPSVSDRKKIQLALWADSVNERMTLVDLVWRAVTEPVAPPRRSDRPQLIQVVTYGSLWAFKVYLDGTFTRVVPHGTPTDGDGEDVDRLDLKLGA